MQKFFQTQLNQFPLFIAVLSFCVIGFVFFSQPAVAASSDGTSLYKIVIKKVKKKGAASWYVPGGKKLTAAHRKLPLGTVVEVKNRNTGKKVNVTITDRGPYIKGRVVDLSRYAFNHIARDTQGVIPVKITVIKRP